MIVIAVNFESHDVQKVQEPLTHVEAANLVNQLDNIHQVYTDECSRIRNQFPSTASELGITKAEKYRDYMRQFHQLIDAQLKDLPKPSWYGYDFFIL